MRTYELRTYRLKDPAAATAYGDVWTAHVGSLLALGIETHGVFASQTDPDVVMALVSYPAGAVPADLSKTYMGSAAFRADMAGFDMSTIVRVEETLLSPLGSSPLQ